MNEQTIQTELTDILAGFANQSLGREPEVESVAATADNLQAVVQTTELQAPVATSTDPVTPPVAETSAEPATSSTPSLFEDWDAPAPYAATGTEPASVSPSGLPPEVLSELGKVLGLEQVKGKEDVVQAIAALKTEVERAKGPDKVQTRPELLKAIELDQKGGDYLEYLKISTTDFSKADPVTLYEEYVIDQFSDANGTVDEDKVNEYLDNIPAMEKELKGKELQKRLIADQANKIAAIENEAIVRKQRNDAALRAALQNLNEIDGFKVTDEHKSEVFNWVTGKMMRDLFYGPDGNLDPVKVAKVGFRNRYYEKLDAYQKNKIRNATKREVLAEVTNAQITSPSIPTNPTINKGYGVSDYINSLEQKLINR
jgi:hypothetical protein